MEKSRFEKIFFAINAKIFFDKMPKLIVKHIINNNIDEHFHCVFS